MRVDLLILQLAIIFLPGMVWARIDASYAAKTKPSDVEFFLRTFLFGLFTYAIEFLIFRAFDLPFSMAEFSDAPNRAVITREIFAEVLWAVVLGFILSILWLYATRFKFLIKFLQTIRATKRFGDEDVWDYTFNSTSVDVDYVHVRDFKNRLVYAGWVNTFSESDKIRELVLLDVIVYDFEGEKLYEVPRLYLALPVDSIHVEFPYTDPLIGRSIDGRSRDGA